MYYSKSTGGFYDPEIHGDSIPSDSVEITQQQYLTLLDGQSSGKTIATDSKGKPVLKDRPAPTADELKALCKAQARQLLVATDFSELPSVRASISNAAAFDAYRSTVRKIFLTPVSAPTWPTAPSPVWI